VLLVLPSWLEQYHLVWTLRKKPFCLVLESERFRSQVRKDSVPDTAWSMEEEMATLAMLVYRENQRKLILR